MLLSLTDAGESRYIGNPPEPKRESRVGNTRLDVPVTRSEQSRRAPEAVAVANHVGAG